MSEKRSLSDLIQQMSPRERTLVGAALALALVVGLVYGVMSPGLAASRSAANRNADAVKDLAAARPLASSLSTGGSPTLDAGRLQQSAQASGLAVVDAIVNETGILMRVHGPGPSAILAWAARAGDDAPTRSVVIEPDPSGGVTASLQFAGTTP